MRYTAEVLQDENDDTGYSAAVVAPAGPSERLAARHARAMAAVLRAAKAYSSAEAKLDKGYKAGGLINRLITRRHDAFARFNAAVARLEKVEKEVGRG